MRFAIQLAEITKAEIVFLHVHQVLRASFWSDKEYGYFVQRNRENIMKEFLPFVKSIYRSMKIASPCYQIVVHQNLDTTEGILEYANENKCDYICISTRGGGMLKKIYGTTTTALMARSGIPVLCIPHRYRVKAIEHILYASDMTNYEDELQKVVDFSRPLNLKVSMLHLAYPQEFMVDKNLMEQTLLQKVGYPVELLYQDRDLDHSVLDQINKAVELFAPSVLVMFTDQERSYFERLLISSTARGYSFQGKVPLLTFSKTSKPVAPLQAKTGAVKSKKQNQAT